MKSLTLPTKLYLLVLLPIIGLVWFGFSCTIQKWNVYRDYVALERNSAVLQQVGNTVHELQKERGLSAGFLTSKGAQFATELRHQRELTDAALSLLHERLQTFEAARFGAGFEQTLQTGLGNLVPLGEKRAAISKVTLSTPESTAYYTGLISSLLDVVVAMSHLSKDADISHGISCYVNFVLAKEQAGLERATLTGVFVLDAFTNESFRRFVQLEAVQDTYLRVFASFATDSQRRFLSEKVSGPAVTLVETMRQTALAKSATGGFGVAPGAWFEASTTRINLMKAMEDRLASDYDERAGQIKLTAHRDFMIFGVATLLLLTLTITGAWLMLREITRRLLDIAARLAEGSQEVSAAATQVSAASQATAEGASEQAASLEETSASLEEIASMTKRNAGAATEAKQLSGETHTAADTGSADMQELKVAMDAIKTSAGNIAKILKSIDEIAFQTNILALNAAVEAARAGEAGAGFSVVAEEVRALAQRCALAAKETADKIEESVRNSENGVLISSRVAQHFTEIVTKARQVDTLVAEIATASQEQTQGIGQLNVAVAQMDQITQSNAAGAEETAAQTQQLNAQAVELTAVIGQLLQMVGGRRSGDAHGRPGKAKVGGRRRYDQPAVAPLHPSHQATKPQTVTA